MKQKRGSIVKEEWRDVEGYEGYYQVSNFGKVRSLDRVVINSAKNTKMKIKGRVIKQKTHPNGYSLCGLCKNGKSKTFRVHRLVGSAFIKNPDNKPQINHIDGIKSNNHVDNLEWSTFSENQKHSYELGLSVSEKGENHPRHKLNNSEVLEIRHIYETSNLGYKKISEMYNVSKSTVIAVILRKTWKHI